MRKSSFDTASDETFLSRAFGKLRDSTVFSPKKKLITQTVDADSTAPKKSFQDKTSSFLLWGLSFIQSKNDRSNKCEEGDGFKFVKKPFPHVLIQSQKLCQEVFTKNTLRPKNLGLGNLFGRWLGDCLGCINTNDPAWGQLKKIFFPLFNSITQETNDESLIKEWDKEIQQLSNKIQLAEMPVSIEAVVADLPLKLVLRRVFGATFLDQFKNIFQTLQDNASFLMNKVFNDKMSKWWFYQFLPTQINIVLKQFERDWNMILELATVSESVKNEGVYHKLLDNYKDFQKKIPFKMFSQTLIEIVYANRDVVVPSAAWLLTHYSLYPSFSDPSSFIEESARLSPVFPTSMPKITTQDIVLDNVVIRKGTVVLMDFIALGKSLDWKMGDLDIFRPDRYSSENQCLITRFGSGGRRCPGGRIATHLFKKMLEHLHQNWLLIPAHPYKLHSIEKNPSYPFSMPLFDVWIVHKKEACSLSPRSIYYDCSPMSENTERAFMAISVNERSPFLKDDDDKVDMVVKLLAERNVESVIMIADDIARFNMQAFDHFKLDKAKEKAKNLGDKFVKKFSGSIQRFGQGKINLCRWSQLNLPEDIDEYLQAFPILKSRVALIAEKFLDHRGQGRVKTSYGERINLVTKYILSEIPVLICGIRFQDKWYRLLYYCGTLDHLSKFAEDKGSLHNLTLDILSKPEFSTIKEEISKLVGSHNLYKVPGFIGIYFDRV